MEAIKKIIIAIIVIMVGFVMAVPALVLIDLTVGLEHHTLIKIGVLVAWGLAWGWFLAGMVEKA